MSAAGAFRYQTRAFALGPLKNRVRLSSREPGVAVNQRVLYQRHLAVSGLVGDLGEASFPPLQRILAPTREVQVFPAPGDVALDQPRNGRHIAIPRVAGPVGVAIGAGPFED